MSFDKPYAIFRIGQSGAAELVHTTQTLKDAKYWLTYIALAGDALFQTPAHPKYQGSGAPQYNCHLVARGKVEYDEAKWKAMVQVNGNSVELPAG